MKKSKKLVKGFYTGTMAVCALLLTPVLTGQSHAEEGDDSNIYEAEQADGEGIITDNKHIGFTGEGFVDYDPNQPGGYIEWTITVPEDGEYTLGFRYAHGKTDNRHAELQVDGEIIEEQLDFPQTGDFDDYKYVSANSELTEGQHTVRLTGTADEGGANIDHLHVFRSVDITSEAEDAELEGITVDNKHNGFTGDGFADYAPNVPGGYIEWTVDVPHTGEYTLDFRYAHAGGSKRPAEVRINDKTVEELPFPPTGDWAQWKSESLQFLLQEGENVIRLTATGSEGGGNIDHLRIHNSLHEDNDQTPVETEEVEMSEIVSGVTMKKLEEIGILADINEKADEPVTTIEFIALINNAFGFAKAEDTFKHLGNTKEEIDEKWGSYVMDIAENHHYIPKHLNESMELDKKLTKREAALIIGDLLDLIPENEEGPGMMDKLAEQGLMNPNGENNYGIKSNMTWLETKQMVQELTKHSDKDRANVGIARVDALTNKLIAVTLNGTFEAFDYNDLSVSVPTGTWDSLSPALNRDLRISKAAQGTDIYGNTVLILESMDQLDKGAEFIEEEEEPTFSGDLDAAIEQADNMLTWQMEHGGWSKGIDYSNAWDGEETRSEWVTSDGVELGTIDNDATVKEIRYLAEVYSETGDERYKESVEAGIDFLMDLQYDTGGFAQVYPERGNYSDHVTFNDEAMIRTLDVIDDILNKKYPFDDSDIIDEEYYDKLESSMDSAIDYILNAQIEVDGKLTAWCAQHDPHTYEPVQARTYEHPSISGSESVGIVRFLMSRPDQTKEIKEAVKGALQWFEESKVEGMRYVSGGNEDGEYFVEDEDAVTWYRFYEIATNKAIFSGRDGVVKYDINEIEQERRDGYQWAGSYAVQLLETAKTTGYFEGKVYVQVKNTNSQDEMDRNLKKGQIEKVEDYSEKIGDIQGELVVDQDGSGDFESVQDAIDAVPDDNTHEVIISVKKGEYKEVIDVPANKPFITLSGESAEETIITYDNYAGKDNGVGGTIGTSSSATAFLNANDFKAENITFENSFDRNRDVEGKQAVAVNARGERMIFNNVRFLGHQDTLLANSGTQYYYDSYIEGDVDFIFGGARAVFENSIIHSLDRGSDSNNGYITAASTLTEHPYGFLFLNSELTSDAATGTVYLGRPWQPSGNTNAVASVVYKNSYLGDHIKENPWTEMGGFQPEDARFHEYNNEGPGAVENEFRPQLTEDEASEYTVENVLDGWAPEL
ncbi:pectate lyase [Salibacterium salarium]|nr:pectate lyase [Salibacterium salarium]